MGILPLAVETGRFNGTPLDERICKICNRDVIEDEFHMICKCNVYDNFRAEMYGNLSKTILNFSIWMREMNGRRIHFFFNAWSNRQSCIYKK